MEDWFSITDIDLPDSPALIVYPERVKYNIGLLVSSIDNVNRLRPHVKTHKSSQAVELCLEAGISKFKCATIAEAEMLALCNAPDVLLAYQPVGPKIDRFIALIKHYTATQLACLVDDYTVAERMNELALANQLTIQVYIDLNVGMNRSGIVLQHALALYQRCAALPAIQVKGLHAYDGHIHDEDLAIRAERVNTAFAPVDSLVVQLRSLGFEPVVVAGGTPTFPVHAAKSDIECSPGTFIYWDGGYQQAFTEQAFLTAALVITRVVSLPDETKICVDLGHKSIASENVLDKRVTFLNTPELKFVGHSEEHLVLDAGPNHQYQIGDVLYGLPHHICPTVALYASATTIINKKVSGEWQNQARNRKINF
ncbi:D-TA family PLP-dependent enzyme [Mucilaginibacter paludis]|uniref:Alanine racemase domain protein n=1 Tax=Mucilaginibacter paludis DSM 18603 TaxID=714943 RepID=H1Y8C4_9SPHI|nr:D-TA family PLP-dependent enzyme [Mucilaginibacter paludis]EHQ24943.1 alanine racemase domain protein [Mucilaginibacter paludis DSM 18603]